MKLLLIFAISAVAASVAPPDATAAVQPGGHVTDNNTDQLNFRFDQIDWIDRLDWFDSNIARLETRILDIVENKPIYESRNGMKFGYADIQKMLKLERLNIGVQKKLSSMYTKIKEEHKTMTEKLTELKKEKKLELRQLYDALASQKLKDEEAHYGKRTSLLDLNVLIIDLLELAEDGVEDNKQVFANKMKELEHVKEKPQVVKRRRVMISDRNREEKLEKLTNELEIEWEIVKRSKLDYYKLIGLTALNPDALSVSHFRKRLNNIKDGIDSLSNQYYKELMPEDYARDAALKERKRSFSERNRNFTSRSENTLPSSSTDSAATTGSRKRLRGN